MCSLCAGKEEREREIGEMGEGMGDEAFSLDFKSNIFIFLIFLILGLQHSNSRGPALLNGPQFD